VIKKIFCVFDSAVEDYGVPFFDVTLKSVLRSFMDICSDKSSAIGKSPQDFTLFELGEYETATATFKLHPSPISRGCAIEYVGKEPFQVL
jgi:hypothetical protein